MWEERRKEKKKGKKEGRKKERKEGINTKISHLAPGLHDWRLQCLSLLFSFPFFKNKVKCEMKLSTSLKKQVIISGRCIWVKMQGVVPFFFLIIPGRKFLATKPRGSLVCPVDRVPCFLSLSTCLRFACFRTRAHFWCPLTSWFFALQYGVGVRRGAGSGGWGRE